MNVSSLSSPYQSPAAAEVERGMLVLRKQQDASKAEAQALVALVETSSTSGVGARVNAYA